MLVASQRLRRKWRTLITEVSRFSSWLLYMDNIVNIALDGLLYNQPPLKQDQGIIMGVEVHVCGSFKRFQDPRFKDQFETKVATVNSHFGLSSGFVLVLS